MRIKYYDKDPKKGGKEIPDLGEYFEKLLKDGGLINPVHNFEMLKEFRQKRFEIEKVKFIEERNSKKLKTTEFELNCFYVAWLNHELKVIENWLSDKYPKGQPKQRESTSDQIEILKYEAFIKDEKDNIQNPEGPEKIHLLSIPTRKGTPDEFLMFWLEHLSNNKKGEPSLMNKQDIEHFFNQNFAGTPGVNEIKKFAPKMSKTELCRITYKFWYAFGEYGTKLQYADMLIKNFERFEKDNKYDLCKNIANR
jgi:hypothetical protein